MGLRCWAVVMLTWHLPPSLAALCPGCGADLEVLRYLVVLLLLLAAGLCAHGGPSWGVLLAVSQGARPSRQQLCGTGCVAGSGWQVADALPVWDLVAQLLLACV